MIVGTESDLILVGGEGLGVVLLPRRDVPDELGVLPPLLRLPELVQPRLELIALRERSQIKTNETRSKSFA